MRDLETCSRGWRALFPPRGKYFKKKMTRTFNLTKRCHLSLLTRRNTSRKETQCTHFQCQLYLITLQYNDITSELRPLYYALRLADLLSKSRMRRACAHASSGESPLPLVNPVLELGKIEGSCGGCNAARLYVQLLQCLHCVRSGREERKRLLQQEAGGWNFLAVSLAWSKVIKVP